jgi:hypothetical protein
MAAFSAIEDFYDCRLELLFALVRRDVGGGSLLQIAPMFSADVTSSGLGGRSNLRLAGPAVMGGDGVPRPMGVLRRPECRLAGAERSSDRLPATADAVAHERSDNCLPISPTPRGTSIAGEPVLDRTSP